MKTYAIILAGLAAALFGAATPASKILLGAFPPFQLAGLLYLGAAIGVMPVLLWQRNLKLPWCMDRTTQLRLGGAIASGGILGPVFLLLGLQFASAASVSLWLTLEMVATAVLGYFLFRDRLGNFGWLGLGGTLLAAIVLTGLDDFAGIKAGILVAIACTFWGLDNHLTALIDGITPAQSTFWKGLIAGTVNLAIGIVFQPYAGSLLATMIGLGVGIFAYGVSIVCYITAAQSLGATRSQLIFSSAPFFGVVFSVIVLGEPISLIQIIAMLILVAALVVLFQDQHAHVHSHEPLFHSHLHHHDDEHHQHSHSEKPFNLIHAHWHQHDAMSHAHPHWPGVHHRHFQPH